MNDTRLQDALAAAEELNQDFESEEELFEQLGLRIQDIQNTGGYQRSQQYSADYVQDAEDMLSMADLKKVGQRWWAKLEPQLMSLLCDPGNEEMGQITGGKTIPQLAAALATTAVISALAPPAWVIVATTIVATKVIGSGLDAVCDVWRESLEGGG